LRIRTKIPLFTSITVLISILAVTFYSVLNFRNSTLESIENYRIEQTEIIKSQLKDNVNSAYAMIDNSFKKAQGTYKDHTVAIEELPEELKQSVLNIEQIRFGEDESGYIWINEVDPPYTVIMHPVNPSMNGTVQVFYIKDTKQNVYEAFADVIHRQKGEGFLEYDYYKPGTNERIPKLSFIKLYEPLGWVVGTGIYIDYIEKIVAAKTKELEEQTTQLISVIIFVGIFLIALASLILFILSKSVTDAVNNVREKLFKMSNGQSVDPEEKLQSDEIGDMNRSLNELIEGVNQYSEFAASIETGDLDADFSPLSHEDVLGNSLLDMRESLKNARTEAEKRRIENERRNRANEGYTMFSELMRRGSEDIYELSYSIISNLVAYIDVIQGGIFILNDDNEKEVYLELSASVAYERRKFIKKRIEIGDGLVGACAYEKQKIYIKNIPEKYAEIRSGLGTAQPTSLLIVPLLMEDNLIGVIELASLKKIDDFDIEFTEKVSESIAASLYAAKINARTIELETEYNNLLKDHKTATETIIEKDKEIKRLRRTITTLKEEKSILSMK
jgi:hypothetical protein